MYQTLGWAFNFLDIAVTKNGTNSYDFKIFRKPAFTNVQIKSKSDMVSNISISVFKEFLSRGHESAVQNTR